MYALRSFSRSAAPRVARASVRAVRPQTSLFRQAVCQPKWAAAAPRLSAGFHVSAVRTQKDTVTDELVAKLQSEIGMEEDMKDDEDLSINIAEYLESSPFELQDKPGEQEVVLTRTFGDEQIRITFTVADLHNMDADQAMEDDAMYDPEVSDMDGQSGGANTKGAINQGRGSDGNFRIAPEDRIAPADREGLAEEEDFPEEQQAFPARVNIRIERPGKGALAIEATAQDGEFMIEDLAHFDKAELADPATAEANWARQALYTGPPFNNLDEDLQLLLEKYLEERGINTRMALFIPDYIDHKEQKEYILWLNKLRKFVE